MEIDTPTASQVISLHRDDVMNLIKEKERIENEINSMKIILDNNKHVGISESLVDDDGFPRQDIDVYQVRHARHRIICLQNDFKAIMKRIEEGLHVLHMQSPQHMDTNESLDNESTYELTEPIVRVNLVSPRSPAEEAGLMVNDLILQFGSVNASNFRSLEDIAMVVKYSEGQLVVLRVKRDDVAKRLHLTPRAWAGKGLLGCNIVPMDIVDR